MSHCDRMKVEKGDQPSSRSQSHDDSPPGRALLRKLPPAIQRVIMEQWQHLERALEKEELLQALEGFSRYLSMHAAPRPVLNSPGDEQNWETVRRTLLARLGLVHVLEESEEEVRYRFNLLQEFFARAVEELTARQRQVITLAANAGQSFTEAARLMNLTTAALLDLQHNAYCAIAKTLSLLLRVELERPEMEARRKAVLLEWHEVFAERVMV